MLMKEMMFLNDYRAVISRSEERGAQGKSLVTRLNLWCCNSAVAFDRIKEETRSVILASGTLAPMDSFASELGMQFDVRLETSHVIDTSKQLWAGVVPFDSTGNVVFNWSYKNTENVKLQGSNLDCFCVVLSLFANPPKKKRCSRTIGSRNCKGGSWRGFGLFRWLWSDE